MLVFFIADLTMTKISISAVTLITNVVTHISHILLTHWVRHQCGQPNGFVLTACEIYMVVLGIGKITERIGAEK